MNEGAGGTLSLMVENDLPYEKIFESGSKQERKEELSGGPRRAFRVERTARTNSLWQKQCELVFKAIHKTEIIITN